MQLIDLSVLVENSPSEPMKIKIKRLGHMKGAKQFCRTVAWNNRLPFKQRIKNFIRYCNGKNRLVPSNFPNRAFLSLDIVTLATHMGTHIDAPYHYGPASDGITTGKTVEQLPLEWFYQPAVKLDLRHKNSGDYITLEDIKLALQKIDYQLRPLDIVLIWTGMDKLWGKREYFTHAPGMSSEATDWLVQQGVKVIGIDTYGFDRPFNVMLNDFWKTKDHAHLWPAHFYGRNNEYIQIERLVNLEKIPSRNFILACFPLNVKGLDASWVRAVAILN